MSADGQFVVRGSRPRSATRSSINPFGLMPGQRFTCCMCEVEHDIMDGGKDCAEHRGAMCRCCAYGHQSRYDRRRAAATEVCTTAKCWQLGQGLVAEEITR